MENITGLWQLSKQQTEALLVLICLEDFLTTRKVQNNISLNHYEE